MSRRDRRPCFRLPVSGDDVVRAALAAYYRAGADATAPMDDPKPVAWSDPETFITTMCDLFELRIRCEASGEGHPVESEPMRYARWVASTPSRDLHISLVDPCLWAEMEASRVAVGVQGLAPAVMAQGCVAVAVGAGAPPTRVAGSDATDPANSLFLACRGQQLPPEAIANDTQAIEVTA